MAEGTSLDALSPSKSNHILPNGTNTSPVITVPPPPVSNDTIYTDIIYPDASFTDGFVPATLTSNSTIEVGGIYILLTSVDETLNDEDPVSYYEEDVE